MCFCGEGGGSDSYSDYSAKACSWLNDAFYGASTLDAIRPGPGFHAADRDRCCDGAVFRRRRCRDASRPIDHAACRSVGDPGEPPRTGARQVLRDGDRADGGALRRRVAGPRAGRRFSAARAVRRGVHEGDLQAAATVTRTHSTFGNFSGYTFPSTTITFFSVTFGALGVVAMVRKNAPMRQPVM